MTSSSYHSGSRYLVLFRRPWQMTIAPWSPTPVSTGIEESAPVDDKKPCCCENWLQINPAIEVDSLRPICLQ